MALFHLIWSTYKERNVLKNIFKMRGKSKWCLLTFSKQNATD
jgi:hypothetical protein